jgi:hypothetical protein
MTNKAANTSIKMVEASGMKATEVVTGSMKNISGKDD